MPRRPRPGSVTKADFARHPAINTNPKEVTRASRQGLPLDPDGNVRLHEGIAWWHADKQQRINTPDRSTDSDVPTRLYSGARAKKMAFDATRAEAESKRAVLELRVRAGELLDAEEVRRAWFSLCRITRNRYQGLADRLAPQLANDPQEIAKLRIKITNEINLVLESLTADLPYELKREREQWLRDAPSAPQSPTATTSPTPGSSSQKSGKRPTSPKHH